MKVRWSHGAKILIMEPFFSPGSRRPFETGAVTATGWFLPFLRGGLRSEGAARCRLVSQGLLCRLSRRGGGGFAAWRHGFPLSACLDTFCRVLVYLHRCGH